VIDRFYSDVLRQHLTEHRQMAFVSGPRQVGKTTVCRSLADEGAYLSWDSEADRRLILAGDRAVAERLGLERAGPPVTAVFDEIHRFGRWKRFLKGFYDHQGERVKIMVTGSSRLDVYRRGGDSLMGRYFLFHMHPLTIAELVYPRVPDAPVRKPTRVRETDFAALWEHGGFPDPFVKRDRRFTTRWRSLRRDQLIREDVRDLTRVQEIAQLELLLTLLTERTGGQVVMSSLATAINVSVDTVRRWLVVLNTLHAGFLVRPWFVNVAKSLRKEPKWFPYDWTDVEDPGARAEAMIACHLLKAVQGWTDLGLGSFALHYLRDKLKREVDFVVVRDRKPWFLVEVKQSDARLTPALAHFQDQLRAAHAFQVVFDLDYVQTDCFARRDPTVVPARTFLSQLL
jgi:hypothetical protein